MFEQSELSDIAVEQIEEAAEVNMLREEVDSLKTKLAYSYADFDNYKKRVAKDNILLADKAEESFANDIFSVIDSFDMAIDTMKSVDASNGSDVMAGMQMIMKQFEAALEKHGFKKVDVKVGDQFDVNKCEAVSSEESIHETNTIVRIYCSGWTHNGKLVRPAKVVVAR